MSFAGIRQIQTYSRPGLLSPQVNNSLDKLQRKVTGLEALIDTYRDVNQSLKRSDGHLRAIQAGLQSKVNELELEVQELKQKANKAEMGLKDILTEMVG